jgi:hypothetical protein
MSLPALLDAPAPLQEGADPAALDWLLALLRQAIEGVMAGEDHPLKKANAVARLGNLYLKTYRAQELKRENRALLRRVAEMEKQLGQEKRTSAGSAAAPAEPAEASSTRRHVAPPLPIRFIAPPVNASEAPGRHRAGRKPGSHPLPPLAARS